MNYALTAQVISTIVIVLFTGKTYRAIKPEKDPKKDNVFFVLTFLAMIFVLVTLRGGFAK